MYIIIYICVIGYIYVIIHIHKLNNNVDMYMYTLYIYNIRIIYICGLVQEPPRSVLGEKNISGSLHS